MEYSMKNKLFFIVLVIMLICINVTNVFSNELVGNQQSNGKMFEELKERIKNAENFEQANMIIREIYGGHDDIIGPGLFIPMWKINEGDLVCHPWTGVWLEKDENNHIFLIHTKNTANECILGTYMMFTNKKFLSYLILEDGGRFFLDQSHPKRSQGYNFFMNNSEGIFQVEYLNNIKEDDLLENIPDRTFIARIDFISGEERESFNVMVDQKERMLFFKATDNKDRAYSVFTHWKNYFYKPENTTN